MDPNAKPVVAYLFPGQGSQVVGQGRDLVGAWPEAGRLLDLASDLSGHPLRRYCWEGPLDVLGRTDILQPSLAAVSLGYLVAARENGPPPQVAVGHSLGEFAALVAAESISSEDALRLVVMRGRLMQQASEQHPGTMTAVSNIDGGVLEQVVVEVGARAPLVIANYNSPRQTVLSGTLAGIEAAEKELAARGARVTRLNVSGAWHSPLMSEANEAFRAALRGVELKRPRCRLFLNATGCEIAEPEAIRAAMEVQMVSPVRWTQVITSLVAAGVTAFAELGPGRVLRGLLRHNWTDYKAYTLYSVSPSGAFAAGT